ncbi:MAG: MotA/TolQ/ExbB proton channel family protein, partial [bacterium]
DERIFYTYTSKTSHIKAEEAENFTKIIDGFDEKSKQLMLVNRIDKAAHRLKNTKSSAEVDDIMTSLSDIDRNIIESSYTGVRFLAGVIPILGFLGTVFGISVAITTFTSILEKASSFEAVKPALNSATYNLGIAFDTTLLALFFSGLILLINATIQKREEDLLSAVDEYCIDNLVSRIRVVSSDIAELKETIQESTVELITAVESHTNASQASMNEVNKNIIEVGNKIPGTIGADGDASAELKENIEAMVTLLEDNIVGLQDKLQNIIDTQEKPAQELKKVVEQIADLPQKLEPLKKLGDTFKGLGQIGDIFKNFENEIKKLSPAIANLSEEMAVKINDILMLLLKVNVVAHKLDTIRETEYYRKLNYEKLLNNLFNIKEDKKNG